MSDPANLKVEMSTKLFELSKQVDENGIEFWYARRLMRILDYSRWEDFEKLLERAIAACEKVGQSRQNHFRVVPKKVSVGSNAEIDSYDYQLTRFACYLIAQNGDPRKKTSIAYAQTYFAVKTRQQEVSEEAGEALERLEARQQLTEAEKEFATILFERGFDGKSLAYVKSEGDRAFFTLNTAEMKKKLGVPDKKPLADFLPAVSLNAKSLATSLTNHQTKSKGIKSKELIKDNHVGNNKGVRSLLLDKGVYPEELPPAEDIKQLQKRIKRDDQTKLKNPEKPLKLQMSFDEAMKEISN